MAKSSKKTNDPNAAHAKRVALLQDTLEDVNGRIGDTTRSYADRAIKARSVAPKVVSAGFKAMRECIDAAEKRYLEAQRDDDVGAVSRVDLRAL